MIISRAKARIIFGWLALTVTPAFAEAPPIDIPVIPAPAATDPSDGRAASFLPPASMPDIPPTKPDPEPTANKAPADKPAATLPATTSTSSAPTPAAATTSATEAATTTSAAPASPSPPVTMPSATAETTTSKVDISQPVESGTLPGINPDTVGALTNNEGGLGASMWKGTPRELIDRLLPALTLPTGSATLNNVAQRFLLTTATAPEGASTSEKSLAALRVEKLIALGNVSDAWNLVSLAKDKQVDEATTRFAAEATLLSKEGPAICSKALDIVRNKGNADWQKILIVCQLRGDERDAASLGLDVLHTQDVKDDVFFDLAERNVLGGAKSLPRQLKPLRPLTVALLRLTDVHLPPELYAHPDAAVITELLRAKTRDDTARLNLAERSAARGIISGAQLADVYRTTPFMADQLTNPLNSVETGSRLRAMLYQAAVAEKTPQKRLAAIEKFLQSLTTPLNGAMAQMLTDIIGVTPASDVAGFAPMIVRILVMASKPKEALAWLKITREASDKTIAARLQDFWPLLPLGGLETDSDYAKALDAWLDIALNGADRSKREQIGSILLVFEAAGFAVPESDWARVIDVAAAGKRIAPPPTVLLERLRAAGTANRRGDTVLLALAAADATGGDLPLMSSIETIRALRLVSLPADALALARETTSLLLAPPPAKP